MPRPTAEDRVIRDLEKIAEGSLVDTAEEHFARYHECPQLQQASKLLSDAAERLFRVAGHGAFAARTHTPLPAPPGWLPPPI